MRRRLSLAIPAALVAIVLAASAVAAPSHDTLYGPLPMSSHPSGTLSIAPLITKNVKGCGTAGVKSRLCRRGNSSSTSAASKIFSKVLSKKSSPKASSAFSSSKSSSVSAKKKPVKKICRNGKCK
ncbi:hypothetical protein HY213_00940 [Candidatus Peregrinibacteria bacterium]|nr:hypothetical protein [Candidatus Peregrinibacteria bacterium]